MSHENERVKRFPSAAAVFCLLMLVVSAVGAADDYARLVELTGELGRAEDAPARLALLGELESALEETPEMAPPGLLNRLLILVDGEYAPAVRREAVVLLGRLGDQAAAPRLLELLRDDDDFQVRRHAATALAGCARLGDEVEIAEIIFGPSPTDDYELRARAVETLADLDGTPFNTADFLMTHCFDDPFPAVREALVRGLVKLGLAGDYTGKLLDLYESEGDLDVRRATLVALGHADDPAALEILIEALDDPELRIAALEGLAALPPEADREEAAEAVSDLLDDSDGTALAPRVAATLSALGFNEDAAGILGEALLEEPPGDEVESLKLLRGLAGAAAVEPTVEFIEQARAAESPDLASLFAAAALLGDETVLSGADAETLAEADAALFALLGEARPPELHHAAGEAARTVGREYLERFRAEDWDRRQERRLRLIEEPASKEARRAVIDYLGAWKSDGFSAAVLEYLEDAEGSAAEAAVEILGLHGYTPAVPLLSELARSSRPGDLGLSTQALEALGRIATPEVGPVLSAVLADPATPPTRLTAAARAAASVKDPNLLYPLLELLESGAEAESRAAAAFALGRFADERALTTLARSLQSDPAPAVRREAFIAYCRCLPESPGEDILWPLYGYLAANDPGEDAETWAAVEILFQRLGAERIETLLSHPEPQARRLTVLYLARRGDPADRENLESALADPNLLVNIAAAEALGSLGDPAAAPALKAAFDQTFDLYYPSSKDTSFSTGNVDKLRRAIEDAFHRLSVNPVEVEAGELNGPALNNDEPEVVEPERRWMEVVVDALRLRDAPSTATGAKIGMLYDGDVIEVLSTDANWAEVRTEDDTTGWACIELDEEVFLRDTAEPKPEEEPEEPEEDSRTES